MTEIQPPHYLQEACHTAQGDRQILSSLVCEEGVAFSASGGDNLKVIDGPSGMQITVGSGNAFVQGDDATWQGMYHVTNDDAVDITLSASDPSNDRIDLIVAQVHDSTYSVPGDDWAIEVVEGAPAGSPAVPPVPDSALALAQVRVVAGTTTISTSNITDRRVSYTPCNADPDIIVVSGTTTFVKENYPGLRGVRVRGCGGGGAGGGSEGTATDQSSAGSGGGSGAYFEVYVAAEDLAASTTVTIGAAGNGVSGAAGGDGGTTSFGSHGSAAGGSGGSVLANAGTVDVIPGSGAGGASGTGDYVVVGRPGNGVWRISTIQIMSGKGGDSMLGTGGKHLADVDNSAGNAGVRGGGGGGAISRKDVGVAHAGGDGGNGVVLIEIL